jgi:hypothetical protein
MFGHDDQQNDQQNNDDQNSAGSVTAPTQTPADDSTGLSDESGAAAAVASAPAVSNDNNGYIMDPAPEALHQAAPTEAVTAAVKSAPANGDLLSIKQQALQHLSPLINHLDQTPEEKFRTTMMMIQASDDQTMVSQAYAAAQAIPDEKVRAQALLDIVNEINYFTQQHKDNK